MEIIASLLPSLSTVIVLLSVFAGIVFIILIVTLFFTFNKKKLEPYADPLAPPPEDKKSVRALPPILGALSKFLTLKGYIKVSDFSVSFLKVIDHLDQIMGTRRYLIPWYLCIGKPGSGKTTLLSSLELPQPINSFSFQENKHSLCQWFFFSRGIILDLKGDHFFNLDFKTSDHYLVNLLTLLSRYRSARPINGLILTLNTQDFYGKSQLSHESLYEQADLMVQKILLIQRGLNLQLPIYVVLTKADVIPGFESIVHEIPSSYHQNIFGWSCPYSISHSFSSSWVYEGFFEIRQRLEEIRLDIFSKTNHSVYRDALLLFPEECASICDHLSLFLARIFQSELYQAPPLFRGFYFTCDITMDQAIEIDTDASSDTDVYKLPMVYEKKRAICFARDLFVSKIFPEHNLCIPQKNHLIGFNKGLKLLKLLTMLVLTIGVGLSGYSYHRLYKKQQEIIPIIEKIQNILKNTQLTPIQKHVQPCALFASYIQQLFQTIDDLDHMRFYSFFIPPSWFSSIRQDIQKGVQKTCQKVLIQSIYMQLILKARDIFATRPNEYYDIKSFEEVLNPLQSGPYLLLKKYLNDLVDLYTFIQKYNNLKGTRDPHVFKDMIKYTFSSQLPTSFVNAYPKFHDMVMGMDLPFFDVNQLQEHAQKTLSLLYQNFLDQLFSDKEPLSLVFLTKELFSPNLTHTTLNYIAQGLKEKLAFLKKPGTCWIDHDTFLKNTEFEKLLTVVEDLPFLGVDVKNYLTQINQESLSAIQKHFSTLSAQVIDHPLYPSTFLFEMEKILTPLFNNPFMEEITKEYDLTIALNDNQFLYWDSVQLSKAFKMVQSFETFYHNTLSTYPSFFKSIVARIAQKSVQKNVIKTLYYGQNIMEVARPDAASTCDDLLKTHMSEFKSVYKQFISLLDILTQETAGQALFQLQDLLSSSCLFLLERVEVLLNYFNPYDISLDALRIWDGQSALGKQLYRLESQDDLQAYLDTQRRYISFIAMSYAKPILDVMGHPLIFGKESKKNPLVLKWQRMIKELELYEKKNPKSTLSILESNIEDLNTITIDNVLEKWKEEIIMSERSTQASSDFFSKKLTFVQDKVVSRAKTLMYEKGVENYETLKSFFNKKLKNRFPFKNPLSVDEFTKDAEKGAIEEFCELFKKLGGSAQKILHTSKKTSAYVFLENMEKVVTFFGQLDQDDPCYELEVDFRSPRKKEVYGGYVVMWALDTEDSQIIRSVDEKRIARWTIGKDITMSFRFPRQKLQETPDLKLPPMPYPIRDDEQSDLSITQEEARYTYSGEWGMLMMILLHRISTHETNGIFHNILKFEIPFVLPKYGENKVTEKAIVYNTVRVFLPVIPKTKNAKKTRVSLSIPNFPYEAPDLFADGFDIQ